MNRNGQAGNFASAAPAMSSDDLFVAFFSDASDLVTGNTNEAREVFVRDRALGRNERVSVSDNGAQANGLSHRGGDNPAIGGDGSVVAPDSDATNLVASSTNRATDVFVRMRVLGGTDWVSVGTGGAHADSPSSTPSTDTLGRLVAFQSFPSNLVADDTNGVAHIFVRDRERNTTERVCAGVQGNGPLSHPGISGDGAFMDFVSAATNRVNGDNDEVLDVFVCDRTSGNVELVGRGS